MIITSCDDLLNCIQYLFPGSKFCVWDTSNITKYYGETIPVVRFNRLIDWRETYPCPSEQDILAIPQATIDGKKETLRKQNRDAEAKKDLSILAAYATQKNISPNLTFTQYLDNLEQLKSSI